VTATISPDQFLDPLWRIHHLYKCMDKNGKTVDFVPWDEQREFLANIHSRNDILKCRQRGFTTLMGIVQLDDCVFNPNVRAAILAHRDSAAKLIFQDKVKFPYDNLDEGLRAAVPPKQDSADTLALANNSRFIVTTSVRSGTLAWLHVSEYGKICAENPERAREIRTGSFPAAEGGVITIESTAEGESGDFFDLCTSSEEMLNAGLKLTRKDFKFFFYPWWRAKEYVLPRSNIPIGPDDEKYFEKIANDIRAISFLAPHFRGFTQEQKNWWMTEANRLGSDMKREFPATPREAFEQSLGGAIFADELASAYKFERIGSYPLDPRFPVNTFWDLGRSHGNATAVWLEQDIGGIPRMVGYYEKEGEWIDQHLRNLKEWGSERGVTWGKHYMPHDGDRQEIWLPEGTLAIMGRLGFQPTIVDRSPNKWESIQVGRRRFSQIVWDATACKQGISRLKQYRKEYDDRRGVWRDHPYHGPESNGADAYLTFAESGHLPPAQAKVDPADGHKRKFYDRGDKETWLTA
jgi:hypothetical protein